MFLYGAPIKIEKEKDFAKRELTLHGTGPVLVGWRPPVVVVVWFGCMAHLSQMMVRRQSFFKDNNKGIFFLIFFKLCNLFNTASSSAFDSTVSEDAGIETRTVETAGLKKYLV
jgi:hypothetical protein